MKRAALLSAAVLTLAACGGNPQEATTGNLKKALEKSESNRVCLPLALDISTPDGQAVRDGNRLGDPVIKVADRNNNGDKINREAQKQLEILADKGFYQQETVEEAGADGKIRVIVYTLTDKGAEQSRPTPHGPLFCLGSQEVKKVDWFTTPTPANGVTITKVSYTAELAPESWAKKLIRAGGESWEELEKEQSRLATLVQTNEGWRDWRSLHGAQ